MPGALQNAFQPDPQQQQQPQQPPSYGAYAASSNPDEINNPYVDASIAAQAGGGGQGNTFAQQQAGFASGLRGPGSPTDQLGALQNQRSADAAQKAASIQRAMAVLQAAQSSQTSNLPLLAAAGAMLAPTRTGGLSESLGKGFQAAVPVAQEERGRQLQIAGAQGQLGIEAGSVPLQTTQADIDDFWNRMKLSEQAGQGAALVGGRSEVAQIGAGSRQAVAGTAATSRENVANTGAAAKAEVASTEAQGQANRGVEAERIRSQAALQATQAKIQASVEAHEAAAKLHQDGMDAQVQSNIMNNATRAAAADPDYLAGKKPLSFFVNEQTQGRGSLSKPAAPASTDAAPSTAAPATHAAAPSGGMPLPTVVQNGMRVPDHTKLVDGQLYTLPNGMQAHYDAAHVGFSPVQ